MVSCDETFEFAESYRIVVGACSVLVTLERQRVQGPVADSDYSRLVAIGHKCHEACGESWLQLGLAVIRMGLFRAKDEVEM